MNFILHINDWISAPYANSNLFAAQDEEHKILSAHVWEEMFCLSTHLCWHKWKYVLFDKLWIRIFLCMDRFCSLPVTLDVIMLRCFQFTVFCGLINCI